MRVGVRVMRVLVSRVIWVCGVNIQQRRFFFVFFFVFFACSDNPAIKRKWLKKNGKVD